jgi:hypothetical protein
MLYNSQQSTLKIILINKKFGSFLQVVINQEAFASKLLAICSEYQFNISSELSL